MMPSRRTLALMLTVTVAALAIAPTPAPAAGENLGVNVFGFSHHLKNPWHDELHEFNPGLGLQWTFARDGRGSLDGNVGVYADTFGHANYHLSLGGRVRVIGPVDIGVQMINSHSVTLADGEPVLTPYPFLAARLGRVTWNVTYLPEVQSFSAMPAVATYVTVFPWRRDDDDTGAAPGAGTALEFTVVHPPLLGGQDGTGFLWRQMFDERRALRLGFRLDGSVTTWHDGDRTLGPDGIYTASLLAQYLRRQAPRGPWRTYWATGLEAQFTSNEYGTDAVSEAWRTDVGVEYDLGRNLALAAEYGLRARYSAVSGAFDEGRVRRQVELVGDSARLALLVSRPPAAAGGATPAAPSGSGPVVLLNADFSLAAFDDADVAWQWRPSPDRAWRLVADATAASVRNAPETREEYGLGLRLERLHFRPAAGARTYWGLGPVAGFSYFAWRWAGEDPDFGSRDRTERRLYVGGAALVGAEYPLTAGLHAVGEYGCDLLLAFRNGNDDSHSTTWRVQANGVRAGLAMIF